MLRTALANLSPAERLIVALDVDSVEKARALINVLGRSAGVYKIGHHLLYKGGIDLARELASEGKHVFLDAKLHDIPNTVAAGVKAIAEMGAAFVTVHAYPQTMKAAVEAAENTGLTVLAVTVLTSMSDDDAHDAGYALPPKDLVFKRTVFAARNGVPGLVCSAQEVTMIRRSVGEGLLLITPGVRPAGTSPDDQKRVTTPADAIAAGADFIVVGRPITAASNPKSAANAIIAEIQDGK